MSKRNGKGVSTLKLDPHNARKHPDRNKAQIAASLKELGAGRSILVDATGTIIAGNGVYEQAQALGYKVRVIEADGKTLIAVKRPDLKGAKARRMALADNRATETSEWDVDVLADLAANDADALAGLFDERELRDLLGDKMPGGKEETADAGELVDKAAELQAKWKVERGDVWQVGKHRVMCGDSTNAADVARLSESAVLVVTSPPYGVGKDYEKGGIPEWRALLYTVFSNLKTIPLWFVNLGDKITGNDGFEAHTFGTMTSDFEAMGYRLLGLRVWVKQPAWSQNPYWRQSYKPTDEFEYLGIFASDKPKHVKRLTDEELNEWGYRGVWTITSVAKNDNHSAKFPVEIPARAICLLTDTDAVILDPFLGSGTTLVACEQTGRIGRGMEIEPKYVAVTLERLTALGLEAKRVTDTNGNAKAKRKTKAAA